MNFQNLKDLIKIAKESGGEILKIYNTDFNVEYKDDKSPLTLADKNAHNVIVKGLQKISDYPILSEEGKNIPYEERKNWEYFWMVDPLDGTKEFIKRNGEFTVNIALIHKNKAVLGVVYAPAIDVLYYGGENIGAYKIESNTTTNLTNNQSNKTNNTLTVVASKSHLNKETEQFIKMLEKYFNKVETTSIGSSLKICLVAEKKADIYPRIAPTMEWDTAAAHAVLKGAGGKMVQYEPISDFSDLKKLKELKYNKEDLLNPYFIAFNINVD